MPCFDLYTIQGHGVNVVFAATRGVDTIRSGVAAWRTMEITIGKRLSCWRAHLGLTLQAVADASGEISKQRLALIEADDDQDITVRRLKTIVERAFGTDLLTFLGPLPAAPAAPATRTRRRAA